MSKKFTSFLVLAAALLLTVPTHAQFAKKAAKQQVTALKAGPLKVNDVQKVKAAKAKAAAKYEGQAFTGKMFNYLQASLEKAEENKAILEKQMDGNMRRLANAKPFTRGSASFKSQFASLSSINASRRANRAEEISNGVITAPAEGVRKVYTRAGGAFTYNSSTKSVVATTQEGEVDIVECEDGTVYIQNIVSYFNAGTWVKGTKDGNTISIPVGQGQYYNSQYDVLYTLWWGVTSGAGDNEFTKDATKDVITFTIDGNTISLNGSDVDHPIAMFYDYSGNTYFDGEADYNTVFTYAHDYAPLEKVTITPPTGLETTTWYTKGSNYTSSGSVSFEGTVTLGFDGSDVYLQGMFSDCPDAWMKGTIDGTTVTFEGLQFQGQLYGYDCYAIGTDGNKLQNFVMTYDATAGKFTNVNELLLNAADDKIFYASWIEALEISNVAPGEAEATTGDPVDAVPYSNALSTAAEFADFGVIDSNKDGKTWGFSADYGTYYNYSGANAADDWLISPAIKLEAGKDYRVALDAANAGYPERFEVLIGAEPKASALTTQAIAPTNVTDKSFTTFENNISVSETGYYHFGIHAISDADQFRLYVKNFIVEAGLEATAPAAVTDFALAQAKGKLETIVSFKAPAKNVGGDDLTDLTKIDVLRDGAVVKSIVNVPEGAVAWTASEQGYENAQDVASIDFGSGLTATMTSGGNSNTPKYYTSGTALRMYAKNSMTLKGTAIKKVVFTFKDKNVLEANVGTLAIDGMTGTWTGNADEIVFTVTDGSGNQARIQKIEIETGLTLTPGDEYSYVDNAEDLTAGSHVYQVIPYNATGAGVKSEEKSIFLTVAYDVPHTFDLSQNLLDWFQVIDNNADGKTWVWSEENGAYYPYSSTKAADDYLISMPVKVKSGKKYNVIVNARGSDSYPERMEVKVGAAPTIEGLNQTAIEAREIADGVFTDYEGQFTAAEDGEYFIGIHAISDADMMSLCVMSITVELAPEATAPAAVADFAVVAGEEGALEANLAFTTPAKAVNGEDLTGNVDVKIYRDGEVINTLTGLALGTATTWKDETVEGGAHTYYVVAANESGDGLKSDKVSVFVGIDEVGEVANIQVTGTTANTISMSWDAVAGKNGGYVNLADVKYAVVSMHVETVWFWQVLVVDDVLATVTGQTSATFDYPCDEGEQDYKYFGVVALQGDAAAPAAGDEYAGGYTWALVGAPYELPFAESFTGGNLAYGTWAVEGCENTYGFFTGVASDDDCALGITTVDEAGLVRLESGRVNIKGVANPTLLFDAMGMGATNAKVFASKDGGDWEVIATVPVTEDYSTVKVSLANVNTERFVRFAIGIDVTNPSVATGYDDNGNVVLDYGDLLLIDNIKIVDLYQYNLVADIKAPKSVVAGKSAKVLATVTNAGENAATNYTVTIKAGEKVLASVLADETLEPFASDEISVDFETSVFDEAGDITLSVDVDYENELFPDDNTASTIITVKEPAAVAPTSLLAEDKGNAGVDLTWAVASGDAAPAQVTEDFENAEVFEPFGLGGITADVHTGEFGDWTVYDGNGIGTYGFNGTDFPNAYQPMGFLVFNPSQVSDDMAAAYAPHSGDQFMISFCPVEENNAPAADHWMISPALTGDAQTISFYARVITDQYGPETFEVWASSTDKEIASFTKVADLSTDATEWTEFTASLPAGTKYFAIRHTSTDVFGLMIDDVTFISTGASEAPASFNIYFEQDKLASVEGDKTTYNVPANKLAAGEHTFAVTAVYANGAESKPVIATVTVTTDIRQIAADGKAVDVYSLDGKLIRSQATSLDGLKGFYIVNGKKVMVK